MSWDERLFGLGFRLWQRFHKPPSDVAQHAAQLEPLRTRLTLLARALTSLSIEIKEAEGVGGISGQTLLLPRTLEVCARPQDNHQAMLWRTAYSCQVLREGLLLPAGTSLPSDEQPVLTLLLLPRVLAAMDRDLPNWRNLFDPGSLLPVTMPSPNHPPQIYALWLRSALGVAINLSLVSERERALLQLLRELPLLDLSSAQELLPKVVSHLHALRTPLGVCPPDLKLIGYLLAQEVRRRQPKAHRQAVSPDSLPSGTELKKKVRQEIRKLQIEQNELAENPLTHAFEKVKTADDYRGGQKPMDGEDELAEHADALSELDLRNVVRSNKRTQSLYRADVQIESELTELEEEPRIGELTLRYDEWDEAHRRYKSGFCQVVVRRAEETATPLLLNSYLAEVRQTHRRPINELRRRLAVIRNERKWQNRQFEGPELDLPALVDRHANLRAGHTPPDRLYLAQRTKQRDVATLVLIDSSMSMDSWVENRRVVDLARESIVVLGDVLSSFQDQVAIAGFYSNTHEDCRYVRYKDFTDSFADSYRRLLSQPPTGYTRIGPALRHASAVLSKVTAKKRLLLLISDGKPTDYDRYEGAYGVADCRQAIREARREGTFVRMLAIDGSAKAHLAEMFGHGHYQVLCHPQRLVMALSALYTQLVG